MPLARLAELDFSRTGYLKSFGDAFVRLLHDLMRNSALEYLFLGNRSSQMTPYAS